ncbi:MAG: pectin esterase, partial [Ignavibacteriae bacterium]|nr:pectin esterase [Ignavibacteriota bacterium]
MITFFRSLLTFVLVATIVRAQSTTPQYDFTVALDSSGSHKSIQEAVNACRDYAERQYSILVKTGVYREKLVLPSWKTHITIIGQKVGSTIITYD